MQPDRSLGTGASRRSDLPPAPPLSLPLLPLVVGVGSRAVGALVVLLLLGGVVKTALSLSDEALGPIMLLALIGAGLLLVRDVAATGAQRRAFAALGQGAVRTSKGIVVPAAADAPERAGIILEAEPGEQVEAAYAFLREVWTPPPGWRRDELKLAGVALVDGPHGPTDRLELQHVPSGEKVAVFLAFPLLPAGVEATMLHLALHASS